MKIITKLLRDNAKLPVRAHSGDAGADVYCCEDITIKAKSVGKIPLGIAIEVPNGAMAVIHCKSGLSSKGIFASNAPIDYQYEGEVHAILLNIGDEDYTFKAGEKVGQLVMVPIYLPEYVESINEEKRGAGAFGSTGK